MARRVVGSDSISRSATTSRTLRGRGSRAETSGSRLGRPGATRMTAPMTTPSPSWTANRLMVMNVHRTARVSSYGAESGSARSRMGAFSLSPCSTMWQCHTNSPSTSNCPCTLVTSPGTGDERVVRNRSVGPRYGEAAALRRRCVNLLAKRLTVEESLAEVSGRLVFGRTKTHAMRKLPLPASLAAELERHLEERVTREADALLFRSPKRQAASVRELYADDLEARVEGSRTPRCRDPRPPPLSGRRADPRRGFASRGPANPRAPERRVHPHGVRAHLRNGPGCGR
jgi:hypothetical protein